MESRHSYSCFFAFSFLISDFCCCNVSFWKTWPVPHFYYKSLICIFWARWILSRSVASLSTWSYGIFLPFFHICVVTFVFSLNLQISRPPLRRKLSWICVFPFYHRIHTDVEDDCAEAVILSDPCRTVFFWLISNPVICSVSTVQILNYINYLFNIGPVPVIVWGTTVVLLYQVLWKSNCIISTYLKLSNPSYLKPTYHLAVFTVDVDEP